MPAACRAAFGGRGCRCRCLAGSWDGEWGVSGWKVPLAWTGGEGQAGVRSLMDTFYLIYIYFHFWRQ